MSSILEIDSVMMSFNGRNILSDIYLKCETGDIIGLLGRNGCGKSTLLKILFGTLKSDHKFIRIDGKIYDKLFLTPDLVSYLPQHNFIPGNISVKKAADLYLDQQDVDLFFHDDLIGKLRSNKVNSLSGGELRYLEIKLLLSLPSKFILLDEPFNGVAPVMVERLKPMIAQQSATKGIILTDHDYNNVLDVANKYCLVREGTIKNIETKSDLVHYQYLSSNSLD
jgi:lipopolysaccharide export system ATP-binding protein